VVRNNSIGVRDTGVVGRVNPEGIRPAAKQLLPKPKATSLDPAFFLVPIFLLDARVWH